MGFPLNLAKTNKGGEYLGLANQHNLKISRTESGDPLENAVAERVNGILKEEYLAAQQIKSVKEAIRYLAVAIRLCNSERPHVSISKHTPHNVHHANEPLDVKRIWKNYYPKNKPTVNSFQD